MKLLLSVTAALEGAVGLALLIKPALPVQLLLGGTLDSPAALTIARVGGAALLAIALLCWLWRRKGERALAGTLLFYNAAAAVILGQAALVHGVSGAAIWPAIGLHIVMAGWCAFYGLSPVSRP